MAQKIPFFNMFADLLPPPELKIRLGGTVITDEDADAGVKKILKKLESEQGIVLRS